MNTRLDRRSFLKLVTLLPLIKFPWRFVDGISLENRPEDHGGDPPNVLILVFDALSATNVPLYGYPRDTTPNLAKFAKRATVFHRHYTGGTFTSPGTASLLTGSYPWSNRALHLYGTVTEEYAQRNIFHLFSGETYYRITYTHNDLAAALLYQFNQDLDKFKKTKELALFYENLFSDDVFSKDHNAAFLGERAATRGQRGLSNQMPSSPLFGMLHRMWRTATKNDIQREYKNQFPRGVPSTNASPLFFLLEDAIDWVQTQIDGSSRPFLGYFHFFPPHEPYNTRREFVNIFDDGWSPVAKPPHFFTAGYSDQLLNRKRREYDEFIAYADSEFGRLVDFMEGEGLLDNTYLVVTSDHGEMFERGILEHITPTLYEPLIRIPLIISQPGQRQRIDVHSPTSSIDVLPTLLQATGESVPEWCEGEVLPGVSNRETVPERSVFAMDAKSNPKMAPLREGTVAMLKGRYKLIHYFGYEGYETEYELFDLINDPEELEDLYSVQKNLAMELQNELKSKLDEVNQAYIRNGEQQLTNFP